MIDKKLESTYLREATEHIGSKYELEETAKYVDWILFGLDLRENEVESLKARIVELEG